MERLNPCFNGRYSQSLIPELKAFIATCLNPCFNGRYSQSGIELEGQERKPGLNPCFNGRYSQSKSKFLVLVVRDES